MEGQHQGMNRPVDVVVAARRRWQKSMGSIDFYRPKDTDDGTEQLPQRRLRVRKLVIFRSVLGNVASETVSPGIFQGRYNHIEHNRQTSWAACAILHGRETPMRKDSELVGRSSEAIVLLACLKIIMVGGKQTWSFYEQRSI